MIDYDPDDTSIKLHNSLYITTDGTLDAKRVQKDVTLDVDVVVNQARQACTCDEETKRQAEANTDDYCLPCQARVALNHMREVAEQG